MRKVHVRKTGSKYLLTTILVFITGILLTQSFAQVKIKEGVEIAPEDIKKVKKVYKLFDLGNDDCYRDYDRSIYIYIR